MGGVEPGVDAAPTTLTTLLCSLLRSFSSYSKGQRSVVSAVAAPGQQGEAGRAAGHRQRLGDRPGRRAPARPARRVLHIRLRSVANRTAESRGRLAFVPASPSSPMCNPLLRPGQRTHCRRRPQQLPQQGLGRFVSELSKAGHGRSFAGGGAGAVYLLARVESGPRFGASDADGMSVRMTLEAQGVVPLGGILAIMRFFSCASGPGGANVILVDTCRLGVGWRAARPSFAGTRARHPPWSTPRWLAHQRRRPRPRRGRRGGLPGVDVGGSGGSKRWGATRRARMAPLAGGSDEPPAEGIHKDTNGPDQASETGQDVAHLPGRILVLADLDVSASRLGHGPHLLPGSLTSPARTLGVPGGGAGEGPNSMPRQSQIREAP